MYSLKQTIKLLTLQKKFLDFPGVRQPYIYTLYCHKCDKEHYIMHCCRSVWCPICNLKESHKIGSIMKRINKQIPFWEKRLFITLTFKNTKKIDKGTIKEYRKAFTKKFLRAKGIKENIKGGIYSFDWTISQLQKKKPINFHLHLLAFSKRYIAQKKLSEVWEQATGDSYIVDIRKVNNMNKAIYEVIKYIQSNKALAKQNNKQKRQIIEAISGTRRYSKFGIAYKQKLKKHKAKCHICKNKLEFQRGEILYPEHFGVYRTGTGT